MSDRSSETDLIRDIIYRRLEQLTEKNIQEQFLEGHGPEVITEIVQHCKDDVLAVPGEDDDAKMADMATILMHYLCTCLLVPTQRKTVLDGVCIDIVIPDTNTLKHSCASSLVLCILSSTKKRYIESKISDAQKIQPVQENIWIISPRGIDSKYKTFVVDPDKKEDASFACIITQINSFLDKNKSSRFRIFKAV